MSWAAALRHECDMDSRLLCVFLDMLCIVVLSDYAYPDTRCHFRVHSIIDILGPSCTE